jgi:outer membrane protein OmpA-like peptidoglycan-associated protein
MNVEASRVTAYGYGDEKPVADNNSIDGRNKNRRVMAVISQ